MSHTQTATALPIGPASLARQVDQDGFAIVPDVLSEPDVRRLRTTLADLGGGENVRRRGGIYGARNLLDQPDIAGLAASAPIRRLAQALLGKVCFAVRATLFDKIPEANWKLGLHQDSVIAVKERREVTGFNCWAEKAGVVQVQPPAEILSRMLALRVHLDDTSSSNGALRILPGSHRFGWLDDNLEVWKSQVRETACEVPAGGVMAMKPLLLHGSSVSRQPRHRRVIHLEFASEDLPGGLDWRWCVGTASA